jgi:gliding motility-associated transport system permease protein/gliding motility-associatede transport system auxiliary component
VAAVKSGQPTAIFEDPFPWLNPSVPGTSAPKMPPGGNNPFQQRQPPEPKGDIAELWKVLGVDFSGNNVIWQNYNPFPKLGGLPHEWVFVDRDCGAKVPFNPEDSISADLQQVLFLFPGAVSRLNSSDLKFTGLVTTSTNTGTIRHDQLVTPSFMGQQQMNPDIPLLERPTGESYIVAAQIRGKLKPRPDAETDFPVKLPGNLPINHPMSDKVAQVPAEEPKAEAKTDPAEAADQKPEEKTEAESADKKPADEEPASEKAADEKPAEKATDEKATDEKATDEKAKSGPAKEPEIHVVVVGDIDCLYGQFFALRARGSDPNDEFDFHFDNVPFVLNILDVLAGDDRFVEIRTRRPLHRPLKHVFEATESARDATDKAREKFQRKFEDARVRAQAEFEAEIEKVRKREGVNREQETIDILAAQQQGQRQLEVKLEGLKNERDEALKAAERKLDQSVHGVQDRYKLWAVLLPPIPPLIVAFIVFFNRRAGEREGVSRARLR